MLSPGSPAPDFALADAEGKPISLHALCGKPVVIFFYPKDETSICTKEACAFRDSHEDFAKAGAVVIGISSDSADSHKDFAAHHRLPYLLLSDPDGSTRRAFGVPKALGLLPGRATFVIDKAGVVRHAYSAPFQAAAHPREALKILESLT